MIQLNRPPLSGRAQTILQQYQAAVDAQPDFPAQVAFAKDDFPKKNVIGNKTFDEIKRNLLKMSSGAERCHYCEDSKADEVEHILPKDVFPGYCYDWNNYTYACGNCNAPKSNKCAVIDPDTGVLHDMTPLRKKPTGPPLPPPEPPLPGINAILDPVRDNPLQFLLLDIQTGSFAFSELPQTNTVEFLRAKYTLEILRLNDRPHLLKARSNAYHRFIARLEAYRAGRDAGVPRQRLDNMITGIREEDHQTVWQEMKRQRDFIPELHQLFDQVPEALHW